MITNVHSAAMCFEETTNTLKYASRAKKIKMVVSSNVSNVEFHISEYQKIISGLRAEVILHGPNPNLHGPNPNPNLCC